MLSELLGTTTRTVDPVQAVLATGWCDPEIVSDAEPVLAAVTALAVGVVMALARFIGPLGAGFVGMIVFLGIAGGLGWYGYQRLRRDL